VRSFQHPPGALGARVGDGALIDGDADAGPVAEHDAAVGELLIEHQSEGLAEVLYLGREVIGHGSGGGRHGVVRGETHGADREVARVRHHGDAQEVGDPPHRTGLHDADTAGVEHRTVLFEPRQVLARRDGGTDGRGETGVAGGVPAAQRLLDPGEVDLLLQARDVPHRLTEVPRLVGVEHEIGSGHLLADHLEALQVTLEAAAALELRRRESAFGEAPVEGSQFVIGERDVERGGIAGHETVGRAEQAPQRLACDLRFQVPQRRVERSDAAERPACVRGLEHPSEHRVVERRDRPRILSLEGGEEPFEVGVRSHADALDALVGFQDDDRHIGDTRCDEPVDVAHGTTPVVHGAEGAVPRDLHIALESEIRI
jgi:hypothetical protein